MVGAYLFFPFAAMFTLPLWLAIPAAVLGTGLLGALIERTMIRPLLGEPPISVFMVTVGLASVLVGLVELIWTADQRRSEEHTSELQSQSNLVCRLLLEKKKPAESLVSTRERSAAAI